MSDNSSLRQAIDEEEARLARVEKERDKALAKLQELKDRLEVEDFASIPRKPVPSDSLPFPKPRSGGAYPPRDSFSSGRLTLSESIQTASEIPFEVDLVEKNPPPTGATGPRRK